MNEQKFHPYIKIGRKIKNARLEKGLTQQQLAESIGVSRRSIYMIELGRRYNIDWIEMCLIEKVLNIEIEKPTLVKVG